MVSSPRVYFPPVRQATARVGTKQGESWFPRQVTRVTGPRDRVEALSPGQGYQINLKRNLVYEGPLSSRHCGARTQIYRMYVYYCRTVTVFLCFM